MKHLELHRFKKVIGKITFGIFFPNENKRLEQKHGVGKQLDLVLVHVPAGKQTIAVATLRDITGWTVKKATAFIKEGDYPKVIIYNIKQEETVDGSSLQDVIDSAKTGDGIIIEIY